MPRFVGGASIVLVISGLLAVSLWGSGSPAAANPPRTCPPKGSSVLAADAAGAIFSSGSRPVRYFSCARPSSNPTELKSPRVAGYSGPGNIELARMKGSHFALAWLLLNKDTSQARITAGDIERPAMTKAFPVVQQPSMSSGRSTLVRDLKISADGRPAWIGEQLGFPSGHGDAVRQVEAVSTSGSVVVLDEGPTLGARLGGWDGRRIEWTGPSGTRSAIVP